MQDDVSRTTTWERGQRAVINRQVIVTIDKVTPSGRAVTGGRTFDVDGRERTAGTSYYRRAQLEPLTPEIEAEMALVARSRKLSVDTQKAIDTADRWLRNALGSWSNRIPEIDDVEKAEQLLAAIQQVIEVRL